MARKTKRGKAPSGYDSWFEHDLHKAGLKACDFHTKMISYVQERKYEPDFIYYPDDDFTVVYIEAKGRFRDSQEARKYVDVVKSLEAFEELVMVFADPDKPMPRARKRADGTRFSHGDWARKNGIKFYSPSTLPREWGVKKQTRKPKKTRRKTK